MSDAIIVAAITLVGTIITVWATNRKSTAELFAKLDKQSEMNDQRLDAKLEKFQAVTDTKIDELTRKVEKHNNMIERTYALERKTDVMDEKISVANHRIDDLERRAPA